MQEIITRASKGLLPLAILASSALIFSLGLVIHLPSSFTDFFSAYSPALFILLILAYSLCFSRRDWIGWTAAAWVTAFIFAMTLSFLWGSGYSNGMIFGGLIPMRDAIGYYNGAHYVLSGHLLPPESRQAAYRPLFPGFLASLLFLTGKNYQVAIAIIVGLIGTSCYAAACMVRKIMGIIPSAVFMTLLYIYIQPLLGYAYSESLGLALGCLGFVLILDSILTKKINDFLLGSLALMTAVSARAGAFFIFPMLALAAGLIFSKEKRWSFRSFGITLAAYAVFYLTVNTVYSHLMVDPKVVPFGTFALTIYGQVVGGAGYNAASQQLGTVNQSIIFREAWQYFLSHPFSLLIGAAKAYRDFLLPYMGIFSFRSGNGINWFDAGLWLAGIALTFKGIIQSIQRFNLAISKLILASALGIFLSIPFLPPIDGGNRFYAATMAFFYLALAVALGKKIPEPEEASQPSQLTPGTRLFSFSLLFLTLVLPVLLLKTGGTSRKDIIACGPGETQFAVTIHPGSYIDIISNDPNSCGYAPYICKNDFQKNSAAFDPSDREIYTKILESSVSSNSRFFTGIDEISGQMFFFLGPTRDFPADETTLQGCAQEISITKRHSIYEIRSILNP